MVNEALAEELTSIHAFSMVCSRGLILTNRFMNFCLYLLLFNIAEDIYSRTIRQNAKQDRIKANNNEFLFCDKTR